MGPGISSTSSFLRIAQTLSESNCKPTHQIWQSITPIDFTNLNFDPQVFSALNHIGDKYPDNFSLLVRKVVDFFTQSSAPHLFSEAILFLLASSPSPDPWLQTPELYVSSLVPIKAVLSVIFKNLEPDNPNSNLDHRISLLKVACFAFHADYLNSKPSLSQDPFTQAFEHISSVSFIKNTFDLISQRNTNLRYITMTRSYAAVTTACIDTCASWKTALKHIDHADIHLSFLPFLEFVLAPFDDAVVSLLYVTLLHYPSFTRFLELNDLGPLYIVALLFFLQQRAEQEKVSFIQTVALLCIGRLTASFQTLLQLNNPYGGKFPTKHRIHRGTYVDLLIEILTNITMKERALEGVVSAIFVNISSTTVSLSSLSSSRITSFLQKTIKIEGISERVLTAFFQFLRFQFPGNSELLLQAISRKRVFSEISGKGKETAGRILEIVDALKPLVRANESDMKKRETAFSIFSKYSDEPLKPVAFAVTRDGECLWKDWLRVLVWQAFPNESRRYRLGFMSFTMPSDNEPSKPQKPQKPEESAESEPELHRETEFSTPEIESYKPLEEPIPDVPTKLEVASNPFGDEEDFQNFLNGM